MSKRGEKRNALLIVDPQNDFHEGGSLAVKGATKDSERIAGLIRNQRFSDIYVTMDTHHYVDIGHPIWWTNDEKEEPAPFATITAKDVQNKKWRAARAEHQEWSFHYLKQLEQQKKFQHTIWPYHCIIGTKGHEVNPKINEALQQWAKKNRRHVCYMWKGTNPQAEMYSAFKAEVTVPGADETKLNTQVLNRLYQYDNIVVCGQASSHCVRHSVEDMVEYFKSKSGVSPHIHLLRDCASPVAGFEKQTDKYLQNDFKDCSFIDVIMSTQLKL